MSAVVVEEEEEEAAVSWRNRRQRIVQKQLSGSKWGIGQLEQGSIWSGTWSMNDERRSRSSSRSGDFRAE